MARDPLERRGFQPVIPVDPNDPARFSQFTETVKDAIVLTVEKFLDTTKFTTERRTEVPTVRKYARGFSASTDPFETFAAIYQEYPDVLERLPHVAVTAAAGQNRPMSIGRPFTATTQKAPRVVTANPEPYALANATADTWSVTVPAVVVIGATYTVFLGVTAFGYKAVAGDTALSVLAGLRAALRLGADTIVVTQLIQAALIVTARALGTPLNLTVSANLSAALLQGPGNAEAPDVLVYQTTPDRRNPTQSQVIFARERFPAGSPPTAALAVDVARIINEQALYATAYLIPVGGGQGVMIQTGGKGGNSTPNEIEVLAGSSLGLVAALGLGAFGNAALGDSITAGPEPGQWFLNIAAAPFTAAMTGFVTLSAMPSSVNDGRFPILAFVTPSQILFENDIGTAEALTTSSAWFIGARDDWKNPLRPVCNRYTATWTITATLSIYCEDANDRMEVQDLMMGEFGFFLEEQFFALLGRSIFDESIPDEGYQISVTSEVSQVGESDFPRPSDDKNRIYESRLQLPLTLWWPIDRPVLVPYGPSAGRSWTLEADDVIPDASLPPTS